MNDNVRMFSARKRYHINSNKNPNKQKMEKLKKYFVLMTLAALSLQLVTARITASAFASGDVVINEVAWAGTADSSNDEWIELYNNTNQSVDLSGWYIEDGSSKYTITTGSVAAHGYFLIEDSEVTVNSLPADAVIGVSLANAGEKLLLKNVNGLLIDSVNAAGGAWYTGNATSKATMERIDPSVSGEQADNWATAKSGNGASGRNGGAILGTPKSANSNFSGGIRVNLETDNQVQTGESFDISVTITEVSDLYAYGFEIDYDPTVFNFVGAAEGNFLKNGGATTSFNAALENDNEGKLIIGNARLLNPATGVSGEGELFTMTFKAVGASGKSGQIAVGAGSFLADSKADVPASFNPTTVTIGQNSNVGPVGGAQVVTPTALYSFELKWTAPTSGADKYVVKKQLVNGSFVGLGETTTLSFTDSDSMANGGKIIPNVTYKYQIIAVKNGESSSAVEVTAKETRGLTGDNDRSGRVDGRDLEKLARSYGSEFGNAEYNALTDTTYDGLVDGSDLIDIGANFGVKL